MREAAQQLTVPIGEHDLPAGEVEVHHLVADQSVHFGVHRGDFLQREKAAQHDVAVGGPAQHRFSRRCIEALPSCRGFELLQRIRHIEPGLVDSTLRQVAAVDRQEHIAIHAVLPVHALRMLQLLPIEEVQQHIARLQLAEESVVAVQQFAHGGQVSRAFLPRRARWPTPAPLACPSGASPRS